MKSSLYYIDRPTTQIKNTGAFYGNYASLDIPFMVNCASCCNTHTQHANTNKKGRLDYYLIYLISGKLDVNTPIGQEIVNEGELIVIPPGNSYKIWCSGETIYFLCVHFTGYRAKEILEENDILLFPKVNKLDANNHLQLRFKTLFEAFAKNDEFRERELRILAERLLIEAGRAKKKYTGSGTTLAKSIRYINENYTQEIKIPFLAQMEAICLTLYNRRFKEEMGMQPSKYIIGLRMRMAIDLLETTSMSIKEISAMCGYNNFNFFARVFKAYTGQAPTEYRRMV